MNYNCVSCADSRLIGPWYGGGFSNGAPEYQIPFHFFESGSEYLGFVARFFGGMWEISRIPTSSNTRTDENGDVIFDFRNVRYSAFGSPGAFPLNNWNNGADGAPIFEAVSDDACAYTEYPIVRTVNSDNTVSSFTLQGNSGWVYRITHFVNGNPYPFEYVPRVDQGPVYSWGTDNSPGTHHLVVEITKEGCPTHIVEHSYSKSTTVDPCAYVDYPIVFVNPNDTGDAIFRMRRNANWNTRVTHDVNGSTGTVSINGTQVNGVDVWEWHVARASGLHHFVAEVSKYGCPTHLIAFDVTLGSECPPCCPDFSYFDPQQNKCVEVVLCPASSPVPVLSDKRGGQVTISFAGWPRWATSVDVLRDGEVVHTFAQADAKSWQAKSLQDFQSYAFSLQARNERCSADASAPVRVTMSSDHLVLTWTKPAAGQDVRGPLALVGDVACDIGLAAQNPVQMLLGGSTLDGTKLFETQSATHHTTWVNRFDPLGADFDGDMVFRLVARDSLGLAAFLDVTVHLALSLAKLTRYAHDRYTPSGAALEQIALVPLLDERPDGSGWIDAFVSSPGAGTPLPYDDFAAMEKELLGWQNAPFDSPFALLGAGGQAATKDLDVVLRFTPGQLERRFALGATHVARTRRLDEKTIEVLTQEPARVMRATAEGVSVVFDLAARGLLDVVDARCWRADKVVAVTRSGVRVCEIDGSSADFDVRLSFQGTDGAWIPETRPCLGVEVVDDKSFLLLYSDPSGSRLWQHDGTDPVVIWETKEQVAFMRAQKTTLSFVLASNAIWSGTLGAGAFTPALAWQHDAPVRVLAFDDTNALAGFADASRVYRLTKDAPAPLGAPAFLGEAAPGLSPWSALGFYAGSHEARLVAGGAAGSVFSRLPGGAFAPIWTVGHGAQKVTGLGHLTLVYVEAKGDPLKGGTPAVTSDALAAFVETGAPGGAFLALVERAKQTRDTSTWARGVQRLVVVPK